jgi:hypothetical protein
VLRCGGQAQKDKECGFRQGGGWLRFHIINYRPWDLICRLATYYNFLMKKSIGCAGKIAAP